MIDVSDNRYVSYFLHLIPIKKQGTKLHEKFGISKPWQDLYKVLPFRQAFEDGIAHRKLRLRLVCGYENPALRASSTPRKDLSLTISKTISKHLNL
jgi:hypothetical protein